MKRKVEIVSEKPSGSKKLELSQNPRDYLASNLASRDDPKWNWMRTLGTKGVAGETVFGKVNQFVELPSLGDLFFPKEFDSEEQLKQVFITLERAEVLEIVWNTLHFGQENMENVHTQSGMILSGPNGVGKTVLSYFIVATAYVNKAIVIYIVLIQFPSFFCFFIKLNQCFYSLLLENGLVPRMI